MWYIFPQLRGLGQSYNSTYYGIDGLAEAREYLKHPVLSARLYEITEALLEHKGKSALEIFGDIDAQKLHSCMTLFSLVTNDLSIFNKVLRFFFDGYMDEGTLELVRRERDIAPQQYLHSLYTKTKDGKMPIVYFPTDGQNPCEWLYNVSWNESEALQLEQDFDTLMKNLRKLAPLWEILVNHVEQRDCLGEEERGIFETFLLPYDRFDADPDLMAELHERHSYDDTLTEEEYELLECEYQWFEEQALKRLPYKGDSPKDFITRARRYARLIALSAPQVVVDEEARRLAEEMVLYYYQVGK
jgi:uncharacterized protein (DUF1810 family)